MANEHDIDDDGGIGALPNFGPPRPATEKKVALTEGGPAGETPEELLARTGILHHSLTWAVGDPNKPVEASASAQQAGESEAATEAQRQAAMEKLMKIEPAISLSSEGAAAYKAGLAGEPMPAVGGDNTAEVANAYSLGVAARSATMDQPVEPEPLAEGQGAPEETVAIPKAYLDALLAVAAKVTKGDAAPEVNQEDLERVNRLVTSSGSPIADHVADHVSSGIGAAGQALSGLVRGTLGGLRSALGGGREGSTPQAGSPRGRAGGASVVAVLPRLSEYRVNELENRFRDYSVAQDKFWEVGPMPSVRKEIEERARASGLSVEDVMEKMKPNGEYADLHQRFIEAVATSPDAQDRRKAMNKAIEGFARQYDRAQEELISPEQDGNEHHEGLRKRVNSARENMFKKAGHIPRFDGEKLSHLERLKDIVQKIMEKVREAAAGISNILRGKDASTEASNEPSP